MTEIKGETSIPLKNFKSSPLDSENFCSKEGKILHMSSIGAKTSHRPSEIPVQVIQHLQDFYIQIKQLLQDFFELKQVFWFSKNRRPSTLLCLEGPIAEDLQLFYTQKTQVYKTSYWCFKGRRFHTGLLIFYWFSLLEKLSSRLLYLGDQVFDG